MVGKPGHSVKRTVVALPHETMVIVLAPKEAAFFFFNRMIPITLQHVLPLVHLSSSSLSSYSFLFRLLILF